MKIPDKLRAIYYILRGDGVICNVDIRGTEVCGVSIDAHRKLFVAGSNIYPNDAPTESPPEAEVWGTRPSHQGLRHSGVHILAIPGQAHRYPIGTILYNYRTGENVRITFHIDADKVLIERDIYHEGKASSWLPTDDVSVVGFFAPPA